MRAVFLGSLFQLLIVLFRVNGLLIPGKTVHTESGSVQGIVQRSRQRREFYSWRGIPYAKPPVGNLRFASPVPYGRWGGVLQAKRFGPRCAQHDSFQDLFLGREDCLTLNIFAPKQPVDEGRRLPVMVYIPGGGYQINTASDYRGNYFMDEDVVLVTMQYRLNALGFLNTNDGAVRGNMGLKDQALALKWVNDNIEYFGGDKYRITLFGTSAGAMSTHMHMMSSMSRGLFHKAITQSGTALSPFTLNYHPERQAVNFAEQLGCLRHNSHETLQCLRSKPVLDILKVHARSPVWFQADFRQADNLFSPTVEAFNDEETFLHKHPAELLHRGEFAAIPWMTGSNSADGLIWMIPFVTNGTFRRELDTNWDQVAKTELFLSAKQHYDTQAIRNYYISKDTDLSSLEALPEYLRLQTDRWFTIPQHDSIKYHAQKAPTYAYYYNKIGPSFFDLFINLSDRLPHVLGFLVARIRQWVRQNLKGEARQRIGASHGDELLMQFPFGPLYPIGRTSPDFEFSRELVKTWVQFATNDTTLSFKNYVFPPVDSLDDPHYFEFNDDPKLVQFHLQQRSDFWNYIENS